jgi:ABC-type amino acid transport substrate-binding protein
MGVRDSSGALSYTLGDGKYAGYHVEICQRIIDNLDKFIGKKSEVKYISVTSQNRIPLTQNGTVDIELSDAHDASSAMAAVLAIAPMRSVALRRMNLDDLFVELVGAEDGQSRKGARIDA